MGKHKHLKSSYRSWHNYRQFITFFFIASVARLKLISIGINYQDDADESPFGNISLHHVHASLSNFGSKGAVESDRRADGDNRRPTQTRFGKRRFATFEPGDRNARA